LYSAELGGREVKSTEACFAPGIDLVNQLAQAVDAPRDKKGNPDTAALPFFFRTSPGCC
jgi:hypothetical protein